MYVVLNAIVFAYSTVLLANNAAMYPIIYVTLIYVTYFM